jgi:23S rRNA (uracil1939-C5)-methyltransferase
MTMADPTDPIELAIERVGAQGDGVAETSSGQVFVPFTLAGERVRAYVKGSRGELMDVVTPSPNRVAPVCRHFVRCGGCAVQHMAQPAYDTWKRDAVVAAFHARGIDAEVSALVRPDGFRRRAVLTARRTEDGLLIGFHEAQSHELVNLIECPVLDPSIVAALPGLKGLVGPLVSRRGEARINVTMSLAGLDIALEGIERTLSPELRTAIAKSAAAMGVARISIAGDPVYEALPPFLRFGAAEVHLPPGTFIQAMESAERVMAARVIAGVGKAKSVVDLFSGLGAFTLPLASKSKVLAVDSDKAAIGALARSVKMATGIKPVTTLVRDLFREPFSTLELNEHEAVVFDPPRAGAEAQSRMLARSKVKTVVAVSCNPATLARDARILMDGGYRMDDVTPIDQFRYSPHIEAVTVFRR